MSRVTIKMKDGTVRKFSQEYGTENVAFIHYVIGFVVVEDVRGMKTSIPSDNIVEITERPEPRF